jgi:hypothetical protein
MDGAQSTLLIGEFGRGSLFFQATAGRSDFKVVAERFSGDSLELRGLCFAQFVGEWPS